MLWCYEYFCMELEKAILQFALLNNYKYSSLCNTMQHPPIFSRGSIINGSFSSKRSRGGGDAFLQSLSWSIGQLDHWSIGPLDYWSIGPLVECQMLNVNKVKLLSERTSGVPPVIFYTAELWEKHVLALPAPSFLFTDLINGLRFMLPGCKKNQISFFLSKIGKYSSLGNVVCRVETCDSLLVWRRLPIYPLPPLTPPRQMRPSPVRRGSKYGSGSSR